MQTKRPNILLFFTDQQRADTCGGYGADLGLTPCLDRLAGEGVLFRNAITNQPVCGPARACLQTGRYATQSGCFRNAIALPDDGRTLAHQLRTAGYATSYIGKWHLALTELEPVPLEKRCGYADEWFAADLLEFTSEPYQGYLYDRENRKVSFSGIYRTDFLTEAVNRYLQSVSGETPFFLMVSYLEPHHQNAFNRYVAPDGYAESCRHLPVPADLVALEKPDSDWRENIADYYGCIRRLDENLQAIVDTLKARGLYDDTILVFTSDHGSHFRTRNSEYKRSCHEASVHIPLVIRGGRYVGGRTIDAPVGLLDVPTSLLHMAGVSPDAQMVGGDLAALLDDGAAFPESVYIQISESQLGRALRTARWKYCIIAPDADGWEAPYSDVYVEYALYDLRNDPHELVNQIANPAFADIRAALREDILQKLRDAQEPPARILPASPH